MTWLHKGVMATESKPQEFRLKELIARGREQGFMTYYEVNDHLPDDISDPDRIEDIIDMINDMGIKVYDAAPDPDELLNAKENTADELAAEEAAAALAAVETEADRTTDPVRGGQGARSRGSEEAIRSTEARLQQGTEDHRCRRTHVKKGAASA